MMYLSILITIILLTLSAQPWKHQRSRNTNGTYRAEAKPKQKRTYHTVLIKEGNQVVDAFRLEN